MTVYLNGKITDLNEAKISPLDKGFLFGSGVFETLRSYNKSIPFVDKHYKRLKRSAKELRIPFKLSLKDLTGILFKLLEANNLNNAYIRITLSAGTEKPTLFIFMKKLDPIPGTFYSKGADLAISSYRTNNYSFLPKYKTLSYLENLNEKTKALKMKCFNSLYTDPSGKYLTECASANIFVVKGKTVYTPALEPFPILPGIIREVIKDLCKILNLKLVEKNILKTELLNADEVFITNSKIGIIPIKKIGGFYIGKPGKITQLLMNQYFKTAFNLVK
ncbi:MAG: aminotransferase class IV [Elusimicrobia bacterium]|nr:aminotransferase class IV [Elusimicrobiota bacterium]MBU2614794.1 aminotransferase class IV [Elusimicrobiota bacterium]